MHPDKAGEAGRRLVAEVAAALPKVSADGRTYTFRIRKGYRFSPPSNRPVTAAAIRHTFERVLSPRFDWFEPTAADIVGAAEYHAGKASHVSGITARGATLVIRLVKPAPDLPRRLALSPYCVVPVSTPVAPHGLDAPIPSAGPHYLAEHTDSSAVLKRGRSLPASGSGVRWRTRSIGARSLGRTARTARFRGRACSRRSYLASSQKRCTRFDPTFCSDIIAGGTTSDNGDPVEYLSRVPGLPAKDRAELDRIAKLYSPRREARAAALAAKIDRQALYVVYAYSAIPTLVSRRLGCVVHQPEYAGIDLAALCLRSGR